MSRTPLSISKLQDLRLKAIDGTTVIDKYNLLQSLLERELPEGSPSILSEPEFIQREGVVKWYPPIPGEARPFDELTPEEKTKAISLLDENIENLKELAAKLAKSQSANRIYAGKCVEQIVETRDSFKLFMVGDRLIATNWGADAQDGDATRMSGELTEGTGTFLAAPPPVPKAPIQPISQGPTWQQPLTPPPPVGLIPRRRGCLFFLGPLLALLLPLLLLFLLLWFLKLLPWMVPLPQVDLEAQRGLQDKLFSLRDRYSEELEACPIPRDPGAPQAPLTQEGKPLEIPDDDDTLVARGGGSYAGDGTVVDGAPDGELPTAQEDAKVEGDPPLDTPEEPKAPETPPEEPLAPETPPETPEEPKAETPPEPPKSEEPTGMPQPTPDSENKNDGDPLNMPDPKSGDNPENMSWLRGCWNSSTGFTSKRTGEDMEYYYCFDEKGNANVYANVKDQNGQIIDTCRGGAKAQLKDGAMVVESQTAAVCKDGMRNFVPSKVTCKPGEKEAECSLGQSGVDRDFSTRFTKRE